MGPQCRDSDLSEFRRERHAFRFNRKLGGMCIERRERVAGRNYDQERTEQVDSLREAQSFLIVPKDTGQSLRKAARCEAEEKCPLAWKMVRRPGRRRNPQAL